LNRCWLVLRFFNDIFYLYLSAGQGIPFTGRPNREVGGLSSFSLESCRKSRTFNKNITGREKDMFL